MDILFVDDNTDILEQAKIFLKRENKNFRIDTTDSAEKAMKKMKRKNYDIIVSDYKMPKVNGLEFLMRVRGKGNDIPFIMLTGYGGNKIHEKVSEYGANHFLIKGMDPKETYSVLAENIEETLKGKQEEESGKTVVSDELESEVQIDVLFVNGDTQVLGEAKTFLEESDGRLKIEPAESVEKALEKMDERDHNLIVSSIKISERTVLDFLKILRENKHNEIPFIIFTKKENKNEAKKGLELGGDHVVLRSGDPENDYSTLARKIIEIAETKKF